MLRGPVGVAQCRGAVTVDEGSAGGNGMASSRAMLSRSASIAAESDDLM